MGWEGGSKRQSEVQWAGGGGGDMGIWFLTHNSANVCPIRI